MNEILHPSVNAGFLPCSGETWRDPYPMYRQLQVHDPAHWVAKGDYWVLTRFDDVYQAARDHQRFSSAQGLTVTYGEREKIGLDAIAPMVMLDPPEHSAFRRLVSRAMTPRQVAQIDALVRAFVRERLDAWDDRHEVDLVSDLAKPVANFVVAHFLGVPAIDRERFAEWAEAIVEANAHGDITIAGKALTSLIVYFDDLIRHRIDHPGDDLISLLAKPGQNAIPVPIAQILGFAFTMVAGGNDTATGLIAAGISILANDQWNPVDEPEHNGIPPAVVEELIRLISPVQGLARTATQDIDIHGKKIPQGRKVLLCYGAANRDVNEFGSDADQFHPDRNAPRMLAFGSGAHHCLGAAAARLEVRIAWEEVFARYPKIAVDESAGVFAKGSAVRRFANLPAAPGVRR